jgi:hypothetical protein
MTNLVTKNTTSGSGTNINGNNLKISLKGAKIKGCPINIGQRIQAEQKITVMSKFNSLTDMRTQMTTALQNTAAQQSSATQGALATTIGVQNSKQEIDQKIKNIVETNITNETLNSVNGFLQNINNGEYDMSGLEYECPPGSPGLVVTQDIISKQTIEMLSSAVIGNTVAATTDTKAVAESKQVTDIKQQGAIDAVGGVITSGLMAMVAPLVALIILAILIMIIWKFATGGSKAASFGAMLFGRKKFRFGRR